MMSAEDLDMVSFRQNIESVDIFGSDRSFDVNPFEAESTFYTIRARKTITTFSTILALIALWDVIDDVTKLILPTYLIVMMLYDEII